MEPPTDILDQPEVPEDMLIDPRQRQPFPHSNEEPKNSVFSMPIRFSVIMKCCFVSGNHHQDNYSSSHNNGGTWACK